MTFTDRESFQGLFPFFLKKRKRKIKGCLKDFLSDQVSFVEAKGERRQHRQHDSTTSNPKSACLMFKILNDPRNLMSYHAEY